MSGLCCRCGPCLDPWSVLQSEALLMFKGHAELFSFLTGTQYSGDNSDMGTGKLVPLPCQVAQKSEWADQLSYHLGPPP